MVTVMKMQELKVDVKINVALVIIALAYLLDALLR